MPSQSSSWPRRPYERMNDRAITEEQAGCRWDSGYCHLSVFKGPWFDPRPWQDFFFDKATALSEKSVLTFIATEKLGKESQ